MIRKLIEYVSSFISPLYHDVPAGSALQGASCCFVLFSFFLLVRLPEGMEEKRLLSALLSTRPLGTVCVEAGLPRRDRKGPSLLPSHSLLLSSLSLAKSCHRYSKVDTGQVLCLTHVTSLSLSLFLLSCLFFSLSVCLTRILFLVVPFFLSNSLSSTFSPSLSLFIKDFYTRDVVPGVCLVYSLGEKMVRGNLLLSRSQSSRRPTCET